MSVVLHHLEYSRSTRVIWLLEEMGTPYEMVRHQRDPQTFRAPPELAEVHPLSKAPTVIIDGHVMVESGAIIEYLIERFGSETLAPANGCILPKARCPARSSSPRLARVSAAWAPCSADFWVQK